MGVVRYDPPKTEDRLAPGGSQAARSLGHERGDAGMMGAEGVGLTEWCGALGLLIVAGSRPRTPG